MSLGNPFPRVSGDRPDHFPALAGYHQHAASGEQRERFFYIQISALWLSLPRFLDGKVWAIRHSFRASPGFICGLIL